MRDSTTPTINLAMKKTITATPPKPSANPKRV